MRLKPVIWAMFVGVIFGLTGIVLYWAVQPRIEFIKPSVKMITQYQGDSVAIDVTPDAYAAPGECVLHITITGPNQKIVRETIASPVFIGRKYMILTGPELDVGTFEIVGTVEYNLNPLRRISQDFQIAVLHVLEQSNDNSRTVEEVRPQRQGRR